MKEDADLEPGRVDLHTHSCCSDGTLRPAELVRLAASYEQELDRHLKMVVTLIEPALLFLMAALVGTIVIGMLLPIFSLQELIR